MTLETKFIWNIFGILTQGIIGYLFFNMSKPPHQDYYFGLFLWCLFWFVYNIVYGAINGKKLFILKEKSCKQLPY